MYITYNICIMNPYTKTNFGNTCSKLLNLPSANGITQAAPPYFWDYFGEYFLTYFL
jgi:hypothetical protein